MIFQAILLIAVVVVVSFMIITEMNDDAKECIEFLDGKVFDSDAKGQVIIKKSTNNPDICEVREYQSGKTSKEVNMIFYNFAKSDIDQTTCISDSFSRWMKFEYSMDTDQGIRFVLTDWGKTIASEKVDGSAKSVKGGDKCSCEFLDGKAFDSPDGPFSIKKSLVDPEICEWIAKDKVERMLFDFRITDGKCTVNFGKMSADQIKYQMNEISTTIKIGSNKFVYNGKK